MGDADELNEFIQTKDELLRFYASKETSHGTLIIGLVVALFTFVEAIKPTFTMDIRLLLFGLIFWFLSFWFLMALTIHSVVRFSLYSTYSSLALYTVPSDIEEMEVAKLKEDANYANRSLHMKIADVVSERAAGKKVLGVFPLEWFVSSPDGGQSKGYMGGQSKGYMLCFLFAVFPTALMLLLLYLLG